MPTPPLPRAGADGLQRDVDLRRAFDSAAANNPTKGGTMKEEAMRAEGDGNEQRSSLRPVKNPKERLRHLEERESALTAELEAARAECNRLVDEVERPRQGLATGESTVADVGK